MDLLGPADGSDEVVYDNRVRDRYLIGMLATEGAIAIDPERDDDENPDIDLDVAEADASDDPATGRASLFPSSLGLSFAVAPLTTSLEIVAAWGEYNRIDNPTPENARPEWQQSINRVWKRAQRTEVFSVQLGSDGPLPIKNLSSFIGGIDGFVQVCGRCETGLHGHRLVTIFLRNRLLAPKKNIDRAWLFQPSLTVRLQDRSAGFCGRGEAVGPVVRAGEDRWEQDRLDLQYRHQIEFARGHGVSVHARLPDPKGDPNRATSLETSFLPSWEVSHTQAATDSDTPQLKGLVVDMQRLADPSIDVATLQSWLRPLAAGYRAWLTQLSIPSGDDALEQAARSAIDDAEKVADAIGEGIDLLAHDPKALMAFRFANVAMRDQRLRTEAVRLVRDSGDATLEDALSSVTSESGRYTSWRPFQLAFVLLNLPSLAQPTHPDRAGSQSVVDLLFFPTGGGKTEAYLGLVAVTFALRRLNPKLGGLDANEGVAVLMRYTLRLLTAQQFERAASLVCATEIIRRQDLDLWGAVPFRLGLWVGGSLTPNRTDDARKIILNLRDRRNVSGTSPVQLSACPWCGTSIDASDAAGGSVFHVQTYEENLITERTVTYCANSDCPFSEQHSPGEGIPVVTVDDEVYRTLPTFVIGTIDKFAQIPWNSNGKLLFGHVNEKCDRHGWRSNDPTARHPVLCEAAQHHPADRYHETAKIQTVSSRLRPPDLIIQDELHLVTGPLGSLSGLYETAIDRLSEWQCDDITVRPKVVASTATIRRAQQQVRGVFARGTRVFPPQVLDVRETFFAHQVDLDETPGRLYVGVCAQGRRLKEAESRVFRTVMAAAQRQWNLNHEAADPWMTTIGYFSSIRELAGMRRMADDELTTRLTRIERERRHFLSTRFASDADRYPDRKPRFWEMNLLELTSRVGSADLRDHLDRLAQPHRENADGNPIGTDVVLATNMISVGVDVPRLGLMLVVGQPKTTAEYIQASSRVGRSAAGPGLVVTLHNWARPRDLSHWETFEHYHATFYRHVEVQSVTPFADRALDRGLSAVLVALLRGEVDQWTPDRAVNDLNVHDQRAVEIADAVSQRARDVEGLNETVTRVKRMLRDRFDDLEQRQGNATAALAWRGRGKDSDKDNLVGLLSAAEASGSWDTWTLPNSMRNTEAGINVLLRRTKILAPPPAPRLSFGRSSNLQLPFVTETIEDQDMHVEDRSINE
jgi:hypothetical protein